LIHPGVILIPKKDERDILWCPECGTPYSEKDTGAEERFNPEEGPTNQTRIITARKKKKYYDKQ
jgi:hypothetical protein